MNHLNCLATGTSNMPIMNNSVPTTHCELFTPKKLRPQIEDCHTHTNSSNVSHHFWILNEGHVALRNMSCFPFLADVPHHHEHVLRRQNAILTVSICTGCSRRIASGVKYTCADTTTTMSLSNGGGDTGCASCVFCTNCILNALR